MLWFALYYAYKTGGCINVKTGINLIRRCIMIAGSPVNVPDI